MAIYKILLADDEAEIRQGIERKIDWENCGFSLVATAENGQEAYEMVEKLKPDVLLTDIRMPYMDGLQLGEKATQILPDLKLVFFSGFDDFEYAKQAISLQAYEYILKPINAQELSELLIRIHEQLDKEYAEKKNVERLQQAYEESLPVLRDQLLMRIVEGKITAPRAMELARKYQLREVEGYKSVAVVHASVTAQTAEWQSGFSTADQSELIPLSLMNILYEYMDGKFEIHAFRHNDDVTLIGCLSSKDQMLEFINQLDVFCRIVKKYLGLPVCVGIGSAYSDITDLKKSYEGAKDAVDYRIMMGYKAIFIEDIEPGSSSEVDIDEQDLEALLHAIKFESNDAIELAVECAVTKFQNSSLPISKCQIYITELLAELLKLVRTYQLNTEEVFGEDFKGYSFITDYATLDGLQKWISGVCVNISSLIKRERTDSAKIMVDKARKFVQDHFMESEVSIEVLCDYLHLSPSYFSTVFKKETGETFVSYLTKIRMEEAVKLLNSTDDKTYMIAQKVGYLEPNYFSYVFKKYYGISPTKYRSQ